MDNNVCACGVGCQACGNAEAMCSCADTCECENCKSARANSSVMTADKESTNNM